MLFLPTDLEKKLPKIISRTMDSDKQRFAIIFNSTNDEVDETLKLFVDLFQMQVDEE